MRQELESIQGSIPTFDTGAVWAGAPVVRSFPHIPNSRIEPRSLQATPLSEGCGTIETFETQHIETARQKAKADQSEETN